MLTCQITSLFNGESISIVSIGQKWQLLQSFGGVGLEHHMDDIQNKIKESSNSFKALYIAFLAMVLSLTSMLSNDSARDARSAHIETSNQYAYFQAKNIRLHMYRLGLNQIEIQTDAQPSLLEKYRNNINQYSQEKKLILAAAKKHERIRKTATEKARYYDYGISFLQIAIVIASASIVAPGWILMTTSLVAFALAFVSILNGFTLYIHVPETWPEIQNFINAILSNLSKSMAG